MGGRGRAEARPHGLRREMNRNRVPDADGEELAEGPRREWGENASRTPKAATRQRPYTQCPQERGLGPCRVWGRTRVCLRVQRPGVPPPPFGRAVPSRPSPSGGPGGGRRGRREGGAGGRRGRREGGAAGAHRQVLHTKQAGW